MDIHQGWMVLSTRLTRTRHYFVETSSLCGKFTIKPTEFKKLDDEKDYSNGNCRECITKSKSHRARLLDYEFEMKQKDPFFCIWINPEQ